jgi:hypothetical protein
LQSYSEDGKSAAAEKMAQEWRKKYLLLYFPAIQYLLTEKAWEKKSKTFLSNTQSYVFGAKVFNLKKIKFCSNVSFKIVKVFFYF